MENVSIRQYIDRIAGHLEKRIDEVAEDLKHEIRMNRNHDHPNHVTWRGLITTLLAVAAVGVPLLIAFN